MTLAERIKLQRKQLGMSQELLAEKMGVSRQAVTKWESGQSAPSTEKLYRLAEIFGTTVDLLLSDGSEDAPSQAAEVYALYVAGETARKAERKRRWRKNMFHTLIVVVGYLVVYLLGRVFGTVGYMEQPLMGFLFMTDPKRLTYLYGWLLTSNLFYYAVAISAIPTLFGKKYFGYTTFFGFAAGLVIGEYAGLNPAGASWGMGHYGWAIWGLIFLVSMGMGVWLQRFSPEERHFRSRKLLVWLFVFAVGIVAAVVLIRASIPSVYGH